MLNSKLLNVGRRWNAVFRRPFCGRRRFTLGCKCVTYAAYDTVIRSRSSTNNYKESARRATAEVTHVTIENHRHRVLVFIIYLGSSMKYMGFVLDSRWNFRAYFRGRSVVALRLVIFRYGLNRAHILTRFSLPRQPRRRAFETQMLRKMSVQYRQKETDYHRTIRLGRVAPLTLLLTTGKDLLLSTVVKAIAESVKSCEAIFLFCRYVAEVGKRRSKEGA